MANLKARRQAIFSMIAGATLLSTSGVLIRLLDEASDWQIVFWRGLSFAIGIILVICVKARGDLRPVLEYVGRLELIAGLFLCGALTCFVIAVAHTTVANAIFTMGAVPLFTALLAHFFIGEHVTKSTLLAIIVCMFGIAIMVSDGISTGSMYGNGMALLAALSAAAFIVTLRRGNNRDMLPCLVIGALGSACLAAFVENGELRVTPHDLFICLILGGVFATFSQYLYVKASTRLLGAEISLLATLEFILGPLWVLFIIGEKPSILTAIGGLLVLNAVGWPAALSLTRQKSLHEQNTL